RFLIGLAVLDLAEHLDALDALGMEPAEGGGVCLFLHQAMPNLCRFDGIQFSVEVGLELGDVEVKCLDVGLVGLVLLRVLVELTHDRSRHHLAERPVGVMPIGTVRNCYVCWDASCWLTYGSRMVASLRRARWSHVLICGMLA